MARNDHPATIPRRVAGMTTPADLLSVHVESGTDLAAATTRSPTMLRLSATRWGSGNDDGR
ncbi:MAG: hypothetical protein WCJ64_09250 [Rhodospirillaceae bacterium]